jgi:hypothetical protein
MIKHAIFVSYHYYSGSLLLSVASIKVPSRIAQRGMIIPVVEAAHQAKTIIHFSDPEEKEISLQKVTADLALPFYLRAGSIKSILF